MKRKITKILAALALLVFTMPSLVAWGQTTSSIEINTTNSGVTGSYQDKEFDVNNITFKFTQWMKSTNIQAKKSTTNSLYNIDAIPGTITSIVFVQTGTARAITVYGGTSEKPTNQITSPETAATMTFDFTGNEYNYFSMTTPGNACYFDAITIYYTPSGTPQPTTYTVTYNANGGTGTMTDPNSPYEEGNEVTLLANTFEAPEGMMWNSWLVKDASNNPITVTNGKFTMPASNVTVTAQWVADPNAPEYEWVLTDLADLTSSDVFVIVGNISNTNYTMTNDNGTSNAPTAATVTIANDKITSTIANNIKWNVSGNATDGYTFYPNGTTETWLYCNTTAQSSSNNNMRVGTGNRKVFSYSNEYLETKDTYTKRYVCVYASGPDWRGYTSSSTKISFYKRQVVSSDPSITASNVNIAYGVTSGSIEYTINNPVSGHNLTATLTEGNWLNLGSITSTVVPFTCSANEGEERTATVTLSYDGAPDKVVTVTQAAAPVVYNTIPALFAAATSTSTPVIVNFGDWVVTGVNGGQSFVTDGTNGFIMYQSDHGFVVGNTLSGTVNCNLVLFYGSAEITGLTATTEGLTVGENGAITPVATTIDALQAVNTGSVVTLSNLTYDGSVLSDGTNVITPYTSLYHDAEFEEGKTYNVTGVFVLNNTNKRILPRSADDIEELATPSITVTPLEINVDAEYHQDDLTVTYTNVDPYSNISVAIFYDAEGHETDCSWLWVELKSDKNFRYTIFANEGGARTAYFKIRCNGVYSDMVTVNQAAYVAPPTPGNWVLTSIDELTEDDVFVIVGDNGDTYAMSNGNGTSSAPAAVSVTVVDNTLSGEIGDNIQWNISSNESGYIFYPNGTTENWLYCTDANNGVRVGTENGKLFTIEDGYLKNVATERFVGIYNSQDWRCYTSHVSSGNQQNNIEGQTFAFYKKVEEESYTLEITGYTNDNEKTGYYLIASPVTVDPYLVGMTDVDFDLYYFDQSEVEEWRNYEANNFNLVPGKGYLYAKKATDNVQTYYFNLSGIPYVGDGIIDLTYDASEGVDFPGLNLIGNPFGEEATLNLPFYRMNPEGSGFVAVEETGSTVNAMEGVFVYAEYDSDYGYVTNYAQFTPNGNTSGGGGTKINLTRNRGTVIDNAIVRFDNGRQLPKFQLFENSTKLYIPQGNKDYAIVRSAAQGEMPVSFKAAENGTYTLAVEAENMEMDYLHLIDNMTGMDVDLLQTPSYTFEAKTNDYTSRFRLVFKASSTSSEADETFAYYNGSSWTVSNLGEATLQVVDVTGRTVSSETINGNATISLNQTPGVYMLRLVNGNSVKVQKVVVR